ncbi:unnamed protein product [Polarella glacialis]|uniref:ABC1 atypical kinase-like domain-containing protein n=1 Tax=Polarella glacialis TaxID=89957 RepID=A0A813GGA6_POLGL|nr:unnamed protein product [Polarella glacialis]
MACSMQLQNVSECGCAVVLAASLAEQHPELARDLDLPQRQRFLELLARGGIVLGPQGPPTTPGSGAEAAGDDSEAAADAQAADDEVFAEKFAHLFLDLGGIFPKLAQVLSLRPDLIKNERVLRRLRAVQEECRARPFQEACSLAISESSAFRNGELELRDWPEYSHAGSVAQVLPFVRSSTSQEATVEGASSAKESPDGVVKLVFAEARAQMEIDFRLMRSQLVWMERTGHWTRSAQFQGIQGGIGQMFSQMQGLHGVQGGIGQVLNPARLRILQEVWSVMVGMEAEVLREFDLQHEARCQKHGAFVLESILGSAVSGPMSNEEEMDCEWLEEWRDGALLAAFRPAGPSIAGKAQQTWRAAAGSSSSAPPAAPGLLTRLGRWCVGGQGLVQGLAEGEEHLARLRQALRRLRVRVPDIYPEVSGPHLLAMELARGRSLKQVLDVALQEQGRVGAAGDDSTEEAAKKAAAWFAALLLFVIVPLWGKMLLVIGCCHADPHPGNFKVDGIPGLDDLLPPPPGPLRPGGTGLLGRLSRTKPSPDPANSLAPPLPRITFSVLDWGSCVDLDTDMRQALCQLVISLGDLRRIQSRGSNSSEAGTTDDQAAEAEAIRTAAASVRQLGLQVGNDHPERDAFQAALGMALFDPSVATSHPLLRGAAAQQEMAMGSFPIDSKMGMILRVIAIIVGICRGLEQRLNAEAAERLPSNVVPRAAGAEGPTPFVEFFLVELWRPFAEAAQQRDAKGRVITAKDGTFLFVDKMQSYEDTHIAGNVTVKKKHIAAVTDKHALAAHEFWHRKTQGRWVDPAKFKHTSDEAPEAAPAPRNPAEPPWGRSGALVALSRHLPGQPPQANVAVPGPVCLTIVFKAEHLVNTVTFAVTEISHTEFEVRVLTENRAFRPLPDPAPGAEPLKQGDLAKLGEPLVGTRDAVGRVKTLDIVGGKWGASSRQIAAHEFSREDRLRPPSTCRPEEFALRERRAADARARREAGMPTAVRRAIY